jgi:hypothetical protein
MMAIWPQLAAGVRQFVVRRQRSSANICGFISQRNQRFLR